MINLMGKHAYTISISIIRLIRHHFLYIETHHLLLEIYLISNHIIIMGYILSKQFLYKFSLVKRNFCCKHVRTLHFLSVSNITIFISTTNMKNSESCILCRIHTSFAFYRNVLEWSVLTPH